LFFPFYFYFLIESFSSSDFLSCFLFVSIVSFSLVLAMANLWHVKVLLQLCAKLEDDEKNE
jgi:hypothetical protein